MNCQICESPTKTFAAAAIVRSHRAEYIKCQNCGFMFAVNPNWRREAYSSAITATDIGMVSKADSNARKSKAVIDLFFTSASKFLDYGAGYGLFVRRMRDLGYGFSAFDVHCENVFASQFQLHSLDAYHVPSLILLGEYRGQNTYRPYSGWLHTNQKHFVLRHYGPVSELPLEAVLKHLAVAPALENHRRAE